MYDPINRDIEKKDPYGTVQKLEYSDSHAQKNPLIEKELPVLDMIR